jgi:hypothetical protein
MRKHIFANAACIVLSVQIFPAQSPPMRYREFELGSTVASVAKLAGLTEAEAKIVHARPAMMKDLEWRPRYFSEGGGGRRTDPVELVRFRFHDDRLFLVVVDYDPHRTEGMSEADMIEGVSAIYGPTSKPVSRAVRATDLLYGAADTQIAVWGDADHSVTLVRVGYPKAFRLTVADAAIEKLARTSAAEAVRLDAREAPQREIARLKKEADDAAAADAKAKAENKAIFRP